MKRTQIYIPENMHKEMKNLAQKKDRSMSDLVRQFIEQGLEQESEDKTSDLSDLADLNFSGGPKDLSENIDKYIYQDE